VLFLKQCGVANNILRAGGPAKGLRPFFAPSEEIIQSWNQFKHAAEHEAPEAIFVVYAKNNCVLGCLQAQCHNRFKLLVELGIVVKLEGFDSMRIKPNRMPN
jgi:hypothetical protein